METNTPYGLNASIQREISSLRELRNDIAHNSPIWKHKTVIDQQTAIQYINHQLDKIVEIISWLSSEKVDWLEVHMLQSEARRVASIKYLHLCQRKNTNEFTEPLSSYKRSLRGKLKQLDKDEFDVIETFNNQLYLVAKLTVQ